MEKRSLPMLLFLAFGMLMSCSTYTTPTTTTNTPPRNTTVKQPPVSVNEMTTDILSLINDYRRGKGLQPLAANSVIAQQAEIHSRNMAADKTAFGHDGFEQRAAAISASIGRVAAAAENVALGSRSAREVVDGWIKSAGHRKNIEGNYTHTGIGVQPNSKGVLYFTQIFVRK